MSEQKVKYVLASGDMIRIEYDKIYHNKIFEKKPFDYDKLKGDDKLREDAKRTAFFSGFHACEEFYKLQATLDLINKSSLANDSSPKESSND